MMWVAGVDEAGRGPLAGPVFAAAVALNPNVAIAGLADSKKLSETRRAQLAKEIQQHALAYHVAWADAREIDARNILHASMMAMHRALLGLPMCLHEVRIDGNRAPIICLPGSAPILTPIVKGDQTEPAISAASILAKVARDQHMLAMDARYPEYEFARHKGYPTALHREKLNRHGPCAIHRYTFAPVRKTLAA